MPVEEAPFEAKGDTQGSHDGPARGRQAALRTASEGGRGGKPGSRLLQGSSRSPRRSRRPLDRSPYVIRTRHASGLLDFDRVGSFRAHHPPEERRNLPSRNEAREITRPPRRLALSSMRGAATGLGAAGGRCCWTE
eukprot:523279-Prorocentrum_minimum.AAC.1